MSEKSCWHVLKVQGVSEWCLSIEVISLYVRGYLCLPLVAVVEELLFVVQQFLVRLGRKLKVRTL